MKRFVIGHSGAAIVALGILIAAVTGTIALTLGNDLAGNQTAASARVMPRAYVSAGQGEGLVDASAGISAATATCCNLYPR